MGCSGPEGINLGNLSTRIYDASEAYLLREDDDTMIKDEYERYLLDGGRPISIDTSTALDDGSTQLNESNSHSYRV